MMTTDGRHPGVRARTVLGGAAVLAALAAFSPGRQANAADAPPAAMAAPATQAARPPAAIGDDLQAVGQQLDAALSGHNLSDPSQRAAAAPAAIPLARREADLLDEMGRARPRAAMQVAVQKQTFEALLYLLGDKPTVERTDAAAAGDSAAALRARAVQLHARWIAAGTDAPAQQLVADDLEKLDAAHPHDQPLTMFTFGLAQNAATPALQSRLRSLATETMKNPMATRLQQYAKVAEAQEKAQAEADQTQKALVGKPMTLAGTTVDGKPFSSAQDKGKVVLVDFWATWCPPCRAELPHVKDVYAKYHDQGLEIVGVSNDFDAGALTAYAAQNGMPWPELLDVAAAAQHSWNPLTLDHGIQGIPTMFLIDRSGICRSVTAREDMDDLLPKLLAEK